MPSRYAEFLASTPPRERDLGAGRVDEAVRRLGQVGSVDRHELVVRHALDAPWWRWLGLNQANCGLTIVQWRDNAPPTSLCFNDTGHLPAALQGSR
ncbi:hypothetical protein [Pilimelia columellifera]|uniref:hypothetical protein n=1 Tax=Pilimelia columellifera TaxID=706574 RepID=UPI0031CFD280